MLGKTINYATDLVGFRKPADRQALIVVVKECLAHLDRSADGLDARIGVAQLAASLQRTLKRLERGKRINKLKLVLLFLPTGDLQETAIDNGWGHAFIDISDRFEEAI